MSDVWSLTDGTSTWKIIDVNVVKTLDGLNNATVTLKDNIALDIVVDILYGSSTVLKGYVKSKTKTHDGLYKYEIVELAVELENQIVADTDGSYTFIVTDATVNDVVDTILSGSGWSRGSSDTTSLGAVSFSYTRKLPALFKVLKELRGHKVWFDSTTKTVYFGDSRDDEGTLDYFTLSQETSTRNRNIDKVVVFSNDESVYAEYGSGDVVAIYKYTSAKTEEECSLIAQRIYDELSQPYNRIEVETEINPDIDEGDLVTIDSVSYVVYRVEYNLFTMKVHLNENIHSIFDILGSKIIEMTGTMATGGGYVWVSYDGGWQNVDSSHPAKYELVIDDMDLVDQALITIKTDTFKAFSNVTQTETTFSVEPYNYVKQVDQKKTVTVSGTDPVMLFSASVDVDSIAAYLVVSGQAKILSDSVSVPYVVTLNQYTPDLQEYGDLLYSGNDMVSYLNGSFSLLVSVGDYVYFVDESPLRFNLNVGDVDDENNINPVYGDILTVDDDGYIYLVGYGGVYRSSSPYEVTTFTEYASINAPPNPRKPIGVFWINNSLVIIVVDCDLEGNQTYSGVYAYVYDGSSWTETQLVTASGWSETYPFDQVMTVRGVVDQSGTLHLFVLIQWLLTSPSDVATAVAYFKTTDGINWYKSDDTQYILPLRVKDDWNEFDKVFDQYPTSAAEFDVSSASVTSAGMPYCIVYDTVNPTVGDPYAIICRYNGSSWVQSSRFYFPKTSDVDYHRHTSALSPIDENCYFAYHDYTRGLYVVTYDITTDTFTQTKLYDPLYNKTILVTTNIPNSTNYNTSSVYIMLYDACEYECVNWLFRPTYRTSVTNISGLVSLPSTYFHTHNVNGSVTDSAADADPTGTEYRCPVPFFVFLPLVGNLRGQVVRCFIALSDPSDLVELEYYAYLYIVTSHGHDVNTNYSITSYASYPSNISIIVNGSSVTTIAGDPSNSIEEEIDITSYLQTGTNTIEITSDTKGSVFVSGKLKVLSFS